MALCCLLLVCVVSCVLLLSLFVLLLLLSLLFLVSLLSLCLLPRPGASGRSFGHDSESAPSKMFRGGKEKT